MSKVTTLKQSIGQQVLLIDDNNISRRITGGFLSKLNIPFTDVDNGYIAHDLVQENHYTLILINIMMPGLSGLETAKEIRAIDSIKNTIPIIGMSADNITSLSKEMIDAGMDNFLNKPIDINKLNDLYHKYCNSVGNILQHVGEESFNFNIDDFEKAYEDNSLRKDIIQTFIDEESSDRARLKEAFDSKVNDDIYDSLHYMKGSFTYLKALKILNLTQHMLDLSKDNKVEEVLQLEIPLLEYYGLLLEELKQYFLKF